ncbi:MAG: Hpt domain-containing protein [FCB group bacterium]|jgi:chemotaxis protein histidine kinase CheA|nr:Hpt domain-containing protein [FCB group bacterium]
MITALTTDMDVLRAGLASGLEALESAASQASRLREGCPPQEVLDEVGACLHRAGRVALTVGLAEIGRSAQEVEKALDRLLEHRRELTDEEMGLLDEALQLLRALMLSVNVRTGLYSAEDGGRCLARLKSACG